MPQGLVSSYDLTQGVIVDIESLIAQLSPFDVPVLGGTDGYPAITRDTCFEKKVEWQDDQILTPRSTLNGALTTGTTALVIAIAQINSFGVGDVLLLVNDENVRVTALNADGVTLTVTRAFGGTTATNVASASDVIGVGKALPEGSDPQLARTRDRTGRYNLTQIFGPEKVEVSMTERTIKKYGINTNEMDYQVVQRSREGWVTLEQTLLYGTRYDDTVNELRTMGGMRYYFSVVDSATTTLTDTKYLDHLQTLFDNGGTPTDTLAGSKQKRVISTFESTQLRRMAATDHTRGEYVDTYVSDFGMTNVRLDRWVATSDLFTYNRNDVELDTLRPFQFEPLAKTGDAVKGQVVGEYTLKVRNATHQGMFTSLT